MTLREKSQSKIKDLDELDSFLRDHRNGQSVAHCHGVFDLLHVGHIKHLEEARSQADLLVVTITPDEYVNKGPHRPAFDQKKRAESLAALDCVDFVGINRWPTAIKTIQKLKPDYYVKGPDYADPDQDPTGKISEEEEAVESVGGKLLITSDEKHSSSELINRHLSSFDDETQHFLNEFRSRYSARDVIQYLDQAEELSVLVVGEAIVDEYRYVSSLGQSSKAPMLSVKQEEVERQAGGILAVANHIADFAGQVDMVAMVGENQTQEKFVRNHLHPKVNPQFFYRSDSPTITKRRYVDSYFFDKLFGVYEINDRPLTDADIDRLQRLLKQNIPDHDLVVVVDFGHHMLEEPAIELLSEASPFLALNAQSNSGNRGYHTISKYDRADFPCMAEHELKIEERKRYGDLQKMLGRVHEKLNSQMTIVTRGKNGCMTYGGGEDIVQVPAIAGEITDRVGAGDAFLSLASLCAFQQASPEVVGFVGNAAGAQAVATVGNRDSVEYVPLVKQIESLLK